MLSVLPAILADKPLGATVAEVVIWLGVQPGFVREAFLDLDTAGRAKAVRRKGGRTLYLVPFDAAIMSCRNCYREFERPKKSRRQCCSRSCGIAWSWKNGDTRARRSEGIRAERATPQAKARAAAFNKRRWSRPGERERLAEQNRERWSDPVMRAKLSVGIQRANGTQERRKYYSDLRRRQWAEDEEYRTKTLAGMSAAKERMSEAMKRRWADPEYREKMSQIAVQRAAERRRAKRDAAARGSAA
ncbi:MAG: hypothetical protein KIS96_03650 [Bauldia sp.]|nr:hypothetical protein [Bauldia sp.]